MVREITYGVYVEKNPDEDGNGNTYLRGQKPENTDGLELLSKESMILTNDHEITGYSSGKTHEYHYPVRGDKRIIIINYRDFSLKVRAETRTGSELDVERLKKLFEDTLGFKVKTYKNLDIHSSKDTIEHIGNQGGNSITLH